MNKTKAVAEPTGSNSQVKEPEGELLKFPMRLAKAVHDIVTGKILDREHKGALRPIA